MRTALPAPILATAAVAAAAAVLGALSAPRLPGAEGPVWRYARGGLLYRFHGTFRTEALFETASDPHETRDVSRDRPADLGALRAAFLRYLGARRLEDVPASGREWRERVEGVGYFGPPGDAPR